MARRALFLIFALTLAACGGGAEVSRDSRVAKTLFGAVTGPAGARPEVFGGFAKGCQSGAVALPETGPTWQAMRLSRNRNWAQPETVAFIQELSRFAATLPGWQGLYVGDMSQPRGGPMLTGHRSHQSGLDADIWMLPPDRLNLTRAERESLSSISMRRAAGAYTNAKWSAQHEALLKRAAKDPRVARIFVFPGAKVSMCRTAGADRDWLRKIRPWWGHHYHFHVRLKCPSGHGACVDQAPPPAGDGCAEADGWVERILNPPPPDPNAPPPTPRRDLTVGDLPAQCAALLSK